MGAVRVHIDNNIGRISALAVHPDYQGQGIAQQALLRIENIHCDIKKWFLDTISEESGNCHLYKKIGYRKTGQFEKINDNMTLAYYEKQLF